MIIPFGVRSVGHHRGTLFLDEIGELNPNAQKVFLRVLQEHKFRPVGARSEISSDFRLMAATNSRVTIHTPIEKPNFIYLGGLSVNLFFTLESCDGKKLDYDYAHEHEHE